MPPKKEYLLYAPLSEQQAQMYNHVVNGTFRDWLLTHKSGLTLNEVEKLRADPPSASMATSKSRTRQGPTQKKLAHWERLEEAGTSCVSPRTAYSCYAPGQCNDAVAQGLLPSIPTRLADQAWHGRAAYRPCHYSSKRQDAHAGPDPRCALRTRPPRPCVLSGRLRC